MISSNFMCGVVEGKWKNIKHKYSGITMKSRQNEFPFLSRLKRNVIKHSLVILSMPFDCI